MGFGTGDRPDLLVQSTADVGPGDYMIPGETGKRQARAASDQENQPTALRKTLLLYFLFPEPKDQSRGTNKKN